MSSYKPNEDRNGQFNIAAFSSGGHGYSIYILNHGDCFQGFGGMSSGLVVRKTASLIVRDSHVGGCEDTEYEVNDKKVWARLLTLMAASKPEIDKLRAENAALRESLKYFRRMVY